MGVPAVVQHICLLVVLCSVPITATHHHFRDSKDIASGLQEEAHVKVGIDAFTLDGIEEAAKQVDSFPLEEFGWAQLQGRYVGEMTCHAKHEEGLDLVFFGDSITESFRGTVRGQPHPNSSGVPPIWTKHFGTWRAVPLGIAGDRTVNLLWRLRAEAIPSLGDSVRNVVIQIGTNDFFNSFHGLWNAPPMNDTATITAQITTGIIANVMTLHQLWPKTPIVLLGILPRGDMEPTLGEQHVYYYDQPSVFTPAIDIINKRLDEYAESKPYLTFVDCGHVFLATNSVGKARIDRRMMADALHPSGPGMDLLLECMKRYLQPLTHHRRSELADKIA